MSSGACNERGRLEVTDAPYSIAIGFKGDWVRTGAIALGSEHLVVAGDTAVRFKLELRREEAVDSHPIGRSKVLQKL